MLTKEAVMEQIRSGADKERRGACAMLDGRDYGRLADYFPVSEWDLLGLKLKDGAEAPPVKPWTRENIIADMTRDLEFAFDKATGKRGLSAGLMYEVMKMWMWVLNDELKDHDDYPQYGLPLLKAIAVKYGLPNPIGDDEGNEPEYESD